MKRFLLQIAFPIILVVMTDQLTKAHALGAGFAITLNTGLIGGIFAQAPEFKKAMVLLSMFFTVSSIFILLQFLFYRSERTLSILLSVLLGAFGTNLVDRFRFGSVVDFISIRFAVGSSMVFNVADFIQQGTLILLIAYLLKNHERIWPLLNARKTWLVDRSFQITSSLFVAVFSVMAGFCVALISTLFYGPRASGAEVFDFWMTVGLFLFCIFLLVFGFSIVFFNRAAGPIYAAVRFILKLEAGEQPNAFQTRKTDYFKTLESSLNRLAQKLRS